MKLADNYYESDDFKTILQRYEAARAEGRSPYMEPEEMADLAEYYQTLGKVSRSIEVLDYGLAIFPDNSILLALRARAALLSNDDTQQARHYLQKVIDTDTFDYHYVRAEVMLVENHPDQAHRYLSDVANTLSDDDELDDFCVDTAALFADYNHYDLAAQWLQRSTDYDAPDYQELQGRIAMHQGNYEESERIFNQLIDSDPYSAPYWNHLAATQFLRNNIGDAIRSSEYAMAINPDDPDATLNKANGLFRLGNFHEAARFYHRFSLLCPDDEAGLLFEAICRLNLQQTDEAIALLQQAEAIALQHRPASDDNLADIYHELVLAHSLQGHQQQALHYLDQYAAMPDTDPSEVLLMRAHLLTQPPTPTT